MVNDREEMRWEGQELRAWGRDWVNIKRVPRKWRYGGGGALAGRLQ